MGQVAKFHRQGPVGIGAEAALHVAGATLAARGACRRRTDVTVMDGDGGAVDRWTLTHDAKGLDEAIAPLLRHGRPEDLPVAIESTKSLVIDRLLQAGHPVVPIHPNAFNATRPRWGASRTKSARRLAEVGRLPERTAIACGSSSL